MKKLLLLTTLVCAIGLVAQQPARHGVPATPHPLYHVQPDGDTLHYYLRGDEHYHYEVTLDGFLIKQKKSGKFCYAKENKNGKVKALCKQAHDADKRTLKEVRYLKKVTRKFNPQE